MTEDEGDGTNVGSDESTDAMDAVEKRILGQLEIMNVKKLTRAKKKFWRLLNHRLESK